MTNLVGGQARDEGRALASSGEGGGHLRLSEADPAADGAGVDPDARVLLLGHLSDLKNKQNLGWKKMVPSIINGPSSFPT